MYRGKLMVKMAEQRTNSFSSRHKNNARKFVGTGKSLVFEYYYFLFLFFLDFSTADCTLKNLKRNKTMDFCHKAASIECSVEVNQVVLSFKFFQLLIYF